MLPLLRAVGDDRQPHRFSKLRESLEQYFEWTEADRRERLPSGQQGWFGDHVA
jgi:hypothetical protein